MIKRDVFISFNKNDEEAARKITNEFKFFGLTTFFAPDDLREFVGRPEWEKEIEKSLITCRNLLVYCSVCALDSNWVKHEIKYFSENCTKHDPECRHIYVVQPPEVDDKTLQGLLNGHTHLKSVLRAKKEEIIQNLTNQKIELLQTMAKDADLIASNAFDFYGHRRFWSTFGQRSKVSLFTCGRDSPRGTEGGKNVGRTNIDLWDFQAAIDITRHFAEEHPGTYVDIANPVPKDVLSDKTRFIDLSKYSIPLTNKDCIVVGSPDVSDYAEVALARILGVEPFAPNQKLEQGFRVIKEGSNVVSTFYHQPESEVGPQGIELYDAVNKKKLFFKVEHDGKSGTMYGVFILASNPHSEGDNKILILSGFSGVATRAIALFLTKKMYADEFKRFDRDHVRLGLDSNIAVVLGVKYKMRPSYESRDTRVIDNKQGAITYEAIVELEN